MSQKVSKVKADARSTTQAVLEKQLSTIFGRLHNLYERNNELWKKVAELEHSNVELRKSLKGGF